MLSFQAKWAPVHVKKTRQIKNLEPVSILIETGWVMDPMIVTENLGLSAMRPGFTVAHGKNP
jgi:hypothetical protein